MSIKHIALAILLTISFPLTADTESNEDVWIVEMEDGPEQIEAFMDANYPLIEVLHTYDTLLQAIAVTGKDRHIEKLHQESFITQVNAAHAYHVPKNSPLPSSQKNVNYHPENTDQTGEGVKVGVIDTGLDYTHPDLERNYQSGFDTVDFDDDPMETTLEQGLPTMHGTHVAGIIAGNGKVRGVAPNAELYAYRALGPGGVGTSAEIIAALEEAVNDGMDLINLSLGNEVNSPDSPMTEAVNRATELGVSVVVANGNSGPGNWTVGSPATAEKAISVGAYAPFEQKPFVQLANDERIELREIPLSPPWNFQKRMPIEAVESIHEIERTIHDRILLVEKNQSYTETIAQLMEKGSSAIILYSDEDPNDWEFVETPIPVAYISSEEAAALKNTDGWITTQYETNENEMAAFSSRGLVTSTWDLKPDVIAPGVDMLSTVPNGYASLQGTSMAAPYVAGLIALLKEKHPSATPEELKNRLLTYAEPVHDEDDPTPVDQGTGVAQIEKSLEADFSIENKTLNFGKMNNEKSTFHETMNIQNHTAEPLPVRWDIPRKKNGIQWKIPFQSKILPNATESFEIELSVKQEEMISDIQADYLNVSVGDESVQLPYIFMNEEADYPRVSGVELEPIAFEENEFKLSLYLPEPVEHMEVALISADFSNTELLMEKEEINEGKIEEQITFENINESGDYLMIQVQQNGETYSYEKEL